jgi:hypothetical protein
MRHDHAELGPLMVARAGGLLASRRLMNSVVFDLCRGPGTVTQFVCSRSRARIQRSNKRQKKTSSVLLIVIEKVLCFLEQACPLREAIRFSRRSQKPKQDESSDLFRPTGSRAKIGRKMVPNLRQCPCLNYNWPLLGQSARASAQFVAGPLALLLRSLLALARHLTSHAFFTSSSPLQILFTSGSTRCKLLAQAGAPRESCMQLSPAHARPGPHAPAQVSCNRYDPSPRRP